MNQRIAELENTYFEQLLNVIRFVGLAVPLIVVGCGFMIRAGMLDSRFYHSDLVFILISVGFIGLSLFQWFYTRASLAVRAGFSVGFHILGISYLLFVSGFNSPFLACWLLLLIAADTYFGFKAYVVSALLLLATALAIVLIYPFLSESEIFGMFTGFFFLALTGFVIVQIRIINEHERVAYNKSRRKESLQREKLTTLVNAMGDAVINTDENGIIRIYNSATLSLLDTNATLSGQPFDEVFHLIDDSGNAFKLFTRSHKVDHIFSRRDLSHELDNGEKIKLYLNASPIRPTYHQKAQSGYIFILRDITKEKSLEEERDEFISVVSHELRTPVAITEGNISNVQYLMQQNNVKKDVLKPAIDAAHEQIIFLGKMINDLSTLSRAERGVADKTEIIDVKEMLESMYNEYRPQAEAKGLHLNLDLGPNLGQVNASRLYLEEVIQNFVTNSIKYTQKGSVTIKAVAEGDSVRFSISDTGIGISVSDQKRIFQKFFRSEDYRTRETNGTGLGLYVVQKLSSKLGMHVEVKSRLNHGSTFSFLLHR